MQNPVRGLLHGSAAVAALVGLAVLVTRSESDVARFTTGLFGVALVAMFTVSALYHSLPWSTEWKSRLQRVDHSLIFVVVAATFTPLAEAALQGASLLVGMTLVWGIAVVGIGFKLLSSRTRTGLSVALQMLMGWSALIWLPRFAGRLGWEAVALILAGGFFYTVGAVVFATRRPRLAPRVFSHHELFHLLVMAGAATHFWAVAGYAT